MLFDCNEKLVKDLAKKRKMGKRDIVVRVVEHEANPLVYVGAKSMRGAKFVDFLEDNLHVVDVHGDDEDVDEELEENPDDAEDELDELEELEDADEEDLSDEEE